MTTQHNHIVISNGASREQLEQIYDLLGEVFPIERAYFQTRLDFDSTYDPATTWFATVDGHIASIVQIFPLSIRVGQIVIKVGGMGSVGTNPNYRGMGLAHRILNAQTQWMKQNDYDLSLLLASKHAFYEKVGWKLIPEKQYTFAAPATVPHMTDGEIILFEQQYIDDLRFIYEKFNDKRTYTVVRNETYWNDLLQWPDWKQADCLLLRKNGRILAYGVIERNNKEVVSINEIVYLEEAADGVIDLFVALCQLRPGAKQFLARLPDDHRLVSYFNEQNAKVSELNLSMWKMINFYPLLCKLQPELQERLNHSSFEDASLHIELQCGDEQVYLDYAQQQLTVSQMKGEDGVLLEDRKRERTRERNEERVGERAVEQESERGCEHAEVRVSERGCEQAEVRMSECAESLAVLYQTIIVDERDLISYIMFGYSAPVKSTSDTEAAILQALFPKQNAVFYWTDKF